MAVDGTAFKKGGQIAAAFRDVFNFTENNVNRTGREWSDKDWEYITQDMIRICHPFEGTSAQEFVNAMAIAALDFIEKCYKETRGELNA